MTVQAHVPAARPVFFFYRSSPLHPATLCHYRKGLVSHWDQACITPLKRGQTSRGMWRTASSAVARQHTRCKALTFHKSARVILLAALCILGIFLRKVIFTSLSGRKRGFIFRVLQSLFPLEVYEYMSPLLFSLCCRLSVFMQNMQDFCGDFQK